MKEDHDIWGQSFQFDPLSWLWNRPQKWYYQLRFLLNPAPGPELEAVQDAKGRTYWLKSPDDPASTIKVWRLYYRGEQVGQAQGLRVADEEDFLVGDLIVNPAHQGRRLGSLLLGRVEVEARRQGAAFVTGRIVAKDSAAFPELTVWYQDQGFDVQPVEAPPLRGGTQDVARIKKLIRET